MSHVKAQERAGVRMRRSSILPTSEKPNRTDDRYSWADMSVSSVVREGNHQIPVQRIYREGNED